MPQAEVDRFTRQVKTPPAVNPPAHSSEDTIPVTHQRWRHATNLGILFREGGAVRGCQNPPIYGLQVLRGGRR